LRRLDDERPVLRARVEELTDRIYVLDQAIADDRALLCACVRRAAPFVRTPTPAALP
jgi:hypothetical protein